MVFDDDHARSPERHGGQSRKLEEGIESQKSSRRVEDRPRTDQGRQSSSTRYSHSERSRGYEEDHSRHRDSRITRSNGSRREHEHQERRSKREINLEDQGDRDKYRRIERGNRDKYRRDGRDGRNGTEDSDGHRDSRERDYKKKGADGGSGRERRDVGTGQKRSADEDNRDDERDDKHYGIRRAEKDGHRARRDERESRSMHSNDRDIDRHSRHHDMGTDTAAPKLQC
ncbi:hypothetical protein RJ641_034954 [Dillenia turbinata]|uniref:Uncharacterized protein n=1 Tax=Dillenia turbinata TaxID=194707 RepID=A0AAN8ZBX8_9MAGN